MKVTQTNITVLGVNGVYHESSATLVVDGKTVFAIEEERLNRVKHAKPASLDNPHQLPHQAISACLCAGKITLPDVDVIAFSFNPIKRLVKHRHLNEPRELDSWGSKQGEQDYYDKLMTIPRQFAEMGFKGQFMWVDHEMAHASSTFYPSGFDEAAVISIDGIGEFESASLGFGKGRNISFTHHIDYPHSLGFLWEKMAKYLGFSEYDACKVMSVASFGDASRFKSQMDLLAYPTASGFAIDGESLCFRLEDYRALELLFDVRKRDSEAALLPIHHDIAAALQQTTSEIMLHLANKIHKITGSTSLCLAGGVALNCVANTVLFEQGPFERIFIQPAANDAGTSLGAALWAYNSIMQPENLKVQKMSDTYLGSSFSESEIIHAIKASTATYSKQESIEETVAQLIAKGKVIGWFQGAMEFGPRALGNRSLLADPRDIKMVKHLNALVKHREDHRPFCPSVLTEHATQWFDIKKEAEASKYMLMAYPVNPGLKDSIPAVVHIDGTSRIQRVDRLTNPRYHKLISAFNDITGVPLVLNTSFNDREPIVCTPKDAINTMLRTNIDYLVIGDYLLSKEQSLLDAVAIGICAQGVSPV